MVLCGARAAEVQETKVSIFGEKLSINGGETKLTAAHWKDPDNTCRTLGELLKTTLPPPDGSGKRNAILKVEVDEKASWGALKSALLAAAALGVPKAVVELTGRAGGAVNLDLPGADLKAGGQVVEFPLSADGLKPLTENAGRKMEVTVKLAEALVKQQPAAVIKVHAPVELPAYAVATALGNLAGAKPAGVAFLPIRAETAQEKQDRKDAKDAVDKSLGTLLQPLPKKKHR
jgi:hypothetical protein